MTLPHLLSRLKPDLVSRLLSWISPYSLEYEHRVAAGRKMQTK